MNRLYGLHKETNPKLRSLLKSVKMEIAED